MGAAGPWEGTGKHAGGSRPRAQSFLYQFSHCFFKYSKFKQFLWDFSWNSTVSPSPQHHFKSFHVQEAPRQLVLLSRFLTLSFTAMIHFLQLVLCISARNTRFNQNCQCQDPTQQVQPSPGLSLGAVYPGRSRPQPSMGCKARAELSLGACPIFQRCQAWCGG